MSKPATLLLSDLLKELSESDSIPWDSGAKTVKRYLDGKHGSRAPSILRRLGHLKDLSKRKTRDEVLDMYSSTKDKKIPRTTPLSNKSDHKGVVKLKGSKPNLAKCLNVKRPVHLTEEDQKKVDKVIKKIGPSVTRRVETFQKKHPILTNMLKGAVMGGVVGLAMTATGGSAALAGILGGMSGSTITGSVGAAVISKAAGILSNSAATAAYTTFYGARIGKSLAVHSYFKKNQNKKGTFAYNHPYLTNLGMLA
jgi:hypothetical protein